VTFNHAGRNLHLYDQSRDQFRTSVLTFVPIMQSSRYKRHPYRLTAMAAARRAHANLNAFVPPKGWPRQAESNYNKVDTVASRLDWNAAATH